MTPLPLPTDNLYKFCAFFGVVLIVLPTYLVWTTTADFAKNATNLIRDQRKEQIELNALKQRIKEEEAVTDALTEKNPSEQSESQLRDLLKSNRELLAKIETSRLVLKERDLRAEDIESRTRELEKQVLELRLFRIWGGIIFIVGGLLAVYGFVNWRRLQLKQDELLELELKKARNA